MEYVEIDVKKRSLLVLILCLMTVNIHSFDIYDGKKIDVEMSLLLGLSAYYEGSLFPGIGGFELTNGQIALDGDYKDNLAFSLSVDLADLEIDDDEISFLENAYFQYGFHDFFAIRLGRFKVPFGEEITMGAAERPYIYHSEISDLIAPGRSVGLRFSGKNIFKNFYYKAGVFNDSGTDDLENSTGQILFSALVGYEYKFFETAYNFYYSTDETLAQGLFVNFTFLLKENLELRFFCEYNEQRYYNYYWNHGVFSFLSLRFGDNETVLYFDYFNEDIGSDGDEDKIIPGLGYNRYFLKDKLKLMVDLHSEYLFSLQEGYNGKWYNHKVTIKMILEID